MQGSTLSRTVFSVVLLLAGSIGLSAAGPDFFNEPPASKILDSEARMALGFLGEAQRLLAANDLKMAATWVDRGLQLDPACADLLLLRARILWQQGEPAWKSIEADRAALRSQRWLVGRYADAFVDLVDRLVDSHDYKLAKSEFALRFTDRDLLKDPRLAWRKVQILHLLGEGDAAQALAGQAAVIWPDDPGMALVAFRHTKVPPVTAHRWFDRFKSNQPEYRRALFWYIYSLPPSAERLTRCQEYLAMGGGDRMVYAWAAQSALLLNPASRATIEAAWLERFSTTFTDLDIEASKAFDDLLETAGLKNQLRERINVVTTRAYRDFDHDGLAEERIELNQGSLKKWTVDPNQDRIAELELVWEDGRLVRVIQSQRDRTVVGEYAAYPEIATVSVLDAQGAWSLTIPHRRQELQFMELPASQPQNILEWLPSLDLQESDISLDPGRLRKSADTMIRYSSEGQSRQAVEELRLVDGLPLASRDDSDGDGVFDHLVWYEDGRPVMGFRDIENNGEFNAVEIYRSGQLSEIQYMDPRQGFRYRYDPQRKSTEWDMNQDGLLDVVELRTGNLGLLQSFSTRRDGFFDLKAQDGIIQSVILPSWFD